MEATIRSHEIFLNSVLDRISGIKKEYEKIDSEGNWRLDKRERFGGTVQVGAYGAALSLACEFDNLKLAAKRALGFQAKTPGDTNAQQAFEFLMNECGRASNKAN